MYFINIRLILSHKTWIISLNNKRIDNQNIKKIIYIKSYVFYLKQTF